MTRRLISMLILAGVIIASTGLTEHYSYASSVAWSIEETAFESLYPDGFRFTARITSSAGDIVSGRVVWSHVPGRQSVKLIDIDADTGTLTATWEPGQDRVPPWVGITYYWQVSDTSGNTFQTEPQYTEYADTSREWLRSESDDLIVFSEGLPPAANQLALDAMVAQRETYRAAWGDLLPYKPRAILFGDRSAWTEWRGALTDPGVIGETSDYWGGTVQIATGGGLHDLAYGTVLHEVAHLYQSAYSLMPSCSWLIEGNATFFELNQQNDYEAYVRNLARSGHLPNLLEGPGPGTCGLNRRLGYNVGYTFWVWLVNNYGLDGHRQLITLLREGQARNAAIETVTGQSAQDVEQRWRMWLGASPTPPTLAPTPAFEFLPSPTPFVFDN